MRRRVARLARQTRATATGSPRARSDGRDDDGGASPIGTTPLRNETSDDDYECRRATNFFGKSEDAFYADDDAQDDAWDDARRRFAVGIDSNARRPSSVRGVDARGGGGVGG